MGRRNSQKKASSGFTLLEASVMLVVLMVVTLLLAGLLRLGSEDVAGSAAPQSQPAVMGNGASNP